MNTLLDGFDGGFKYSQLSRNANIDEGTQQLITPLADYYEALGKYCKTMYDLQKEDDKGTMESPFVFSSDKIYKAQKNLVEKYKALKKSHEDVVSAGKGEAIDSYLRAPLSNITGVGNKDIDKTAVAMAYMEGCMKAAKKSWGPSFVGYVGFVYESDEYARQLEKTGKYKDSKEFAEFNKELTALKTKMEENPARNQYEQTVFSKEIEDFADKYRDSGFLHTFENQPGRLSVDPIAENRKNRFDFHGKTRSEQMDMLSARMKTVDPRFMKSSPEFREFRRLFDQLQEMSKRIGDREMNDEERKEYINIAMEAKIAATEYVTKKAKLSKEYKAKNGTEMKFKDSTQKRMAFASKFCVAIEEHLGMNFKGPEALEFNGTPVERAMAKYKRLCELEASKRKSFSNRVKMRQSFYRSMHIEKAYNRFLTDENFTALDFYNSMSIKNIIQGANDIYAYYHSDAEKASDKKEAIPGYIKGVMSGHLRDIVFQIDEGDYVSTSEHYEALLKYDPKNVEAVAKGDHLSGRAHVGDLLELDHDWVKEEMRQLVSYLYDNYDEITTHNNKEGIKNIDLEQEMAGFGFHVVESENGTVIEHINEHAIDPDEIEERLVGKYKIKEKHQYVPEVDAYTSVDPAKLAEYEEKYKKLLQDKEKNEFMEKYEDYHLDYIQKLQVVEDEPVLYAPGEFEQMKKNYEEDLKNVYDGLDDIQKAKIKTGLDKLPTVEELMLKDKSERNYYAEKKYSAIQYEQQFYANAIGGIKKGRYKQTPKPEEKKPEVKHEPKKQEEKKPEAKPEAGKEKPVVKVPEEKKNEPKKPEIKKPEVKPEPKKTEPKKSEVKPEPKKTEVKPQPKKPEVKPQPKAPAVRPGASNQVIYASVKTGICDRYAAVMKSSNFKPGSDKNFDARFNRIADMLVEQGKKQAANPKLMVPDKKLIVEMGTLIDDYNSRNKADANMKAKAEINMHAFEKLMFTGLLDDEAHDNFATFNETDKSYRCMAECHYEIMNQKKLSKDLVSELEKNKNQETQKSKELKGKLMESAYKIMQYNILSKEYTQKYNSSRDKSRMFAEGGNMARTLENFEKNGTAKSFEKIFNSVPEFKKNFEERFISKVTRSSRIHPFTVEDCCLNAVADTILKTGKTNICNNIIKDLHLNPAHVNDILKQEKILSAGRKVMK